jgi:hypothetical protein
MAVRGFGVPVWAKAGIAAANTATNNIDIRVRIEAP